ncbi:MAG: hypothetical protein ABIA74_02205 [bacterium]
MKKLLVITLSGLLCILNFNLNAGLLRGTSKGNRSEEQRRNNRNINHEAPLAPQISFEESLELIQKKQEELEQKIRQNPGYNELPKKQKIAFDLIEYIWNAYKYIKNQPNLSEENKTERLIKAFEDLLTSCKHIFISPLNEEDFLSHLFSLFCTLANALGNEYTNKLPEYNEIQNFLNQNYQ